MDSLCELATHSAQFAKQSQDFLVDMFNDEIESVRLNAINSLRKICHHLLLREDQLDIMLSVLKVTDHFSASAIISVQDALFSLPRKLCFWVILFISPFVCLCV